MIFEKNNITFEIRKNNGAFELWSDNRLLEKCETEKECFHVASMYEFISVPFTVFDF